MAFEKYKPRGLFSEFYGIFYLMSNKDIYHYCPRRDFAQMAKSPGGTLVTRAYIKESTYS